MDNLHSTLKRSYIKKCEACSLRIKCNQFECGIQMMKKLFHVPMFTPFVHHGSLKQTLMGMDASDLDVCMYKHGVSTWTSLMYAYQVDICCYATLYGRTFSCIR